VYFAHLALAGVGTNEAMLTEVLLGKPNWMIARIKSLYESRYGRSLERAVKGDLSGKTETLFVMALKANRTEESIPVNAQAVARDVSTLYHATAGRMGTDELTVCSMFTHSSDAHLRAVADRYRTTYSVEVPKMIKSEFSGHMESALLHIIEGAINAPARDARLLEESMKGFGTKDQLLISRLIRMHWDRNYFAQVKSAYTTKYGKDLVARIRGETSGDYKNMLVALASN
jgi:annexin A7/11